MSENNNLKHIVFVRRLPSQLMWGGLEKVMMDWFKLIDYSQCRVTLAISKGGKELFGKHISNNNLPIEIIEFEFDLYEKSTRLFKDMYQLLKPLKPSTTIFIQGAFTDFRLACVFAGFVVTGKKNIFIHENLSTPFPTHKNPIRKFIQKFINNSRSYISEKVVVVSQEIKDQLVNVWGYPRNKVLLSYHGIHLDEFRVLPDERQKIRQILNIAVSDFVFIVPARLSKVKRIDRVLEAFDRLCKENDALWLLILGDGELKNDLRTLASQKISSRKILFLGHQDQIRKYLNASDCYVNSSDMEGLCIALLEAMACGAISVATKCAGPTELLKNSQTGFLVDKSIEGVYQGMKDCLSLNNSDRRIMIQKGIEFTKSNFEVNSLVKRLLQTFHIPYLKNN